MGRLQYVNRKIAGVKLGQVVAKDLRKRIPPGLTSRTAARDPLIELDITNRGINDEAIEEICDALVASVTDPAGTSKLEELKLKENVLTAKALKPLAKVVRAAASELRDFDLSYNAIAITSEEDAVAWEDFLVAFSSCVVIRRLDLSGNPLGLKGFELLQKVYLREDFLGGDLSASVNLPRQTQPSGVDDLSSGVKQATLAEAKEDPVAEASTLLISRHRTPSSSSPDRPGTIPSELMAQYVGTSGLRSIPFLPIFECSLSDGCAMYLSYIVEHHALVAELIAKVPPPKPGASAAQIEVYDLVDGCNGIIWKPNAQLGKDGVKVLELAEQARLSISSGPDDNIEEAIAMSPMMMPRKASDAPSPFTPLSQRQRRGSMSSGYGTPFPPTPGAMKQKSLDAVRNRIQVEVIRSHGARSNTLWHVALQMLAVGRPLLATEAAQLPIIDESLRKESEVVQEPQSLPADDALPVEGLVPDTPTPLRRIQENMAVSPSPHPIESLWPRMPVYVPEPAPPTQKQTVIFRLNTNKHGQSTLDSERKLRVTVPENKSGPIHEIHEIKPKLSLTPRASPKFPTKQYRTNLPKGLSERVWGQILAYAVGAGDALSQAQMAQVVKYAGNRSSLREEYSRLGKQEHAQIWKVLEQMGCLSYSS